MFIYCFFFGLFLTLFTCVTTASKTSPLNGLKTMAYQEGKKKTSEVDTKLSTAELNSYSTWADRQSFFCLQLCAGMANGSIQSKMTHWSHLGSSRSSNKVEADQFLCFFSGGGGIQSAMTSTRSLTKGFHLVCSRCSFIQAQKNWFCSLLCKDFTNKWTSLSKKLVKSWHRSGVWLVTTTATTAHLCVTTSDNSY